MLCQRLLNVVQSVFQLSNLIMKLLSAFNALDSRRLPLQFLLKTVQLAAQTHLVEISVLAIQLLYVLCLPGTNATHYALISMTTTDFEVGELEATHL